MIRLAIPNKGRISAEILRMLEKIGLNIPENGRKLYANTSNPNIQVVYARAADIPLYVSSGAADLGITGEDTISESEVQVSKLLTLNFGKCDVVVAAPSGSEIKSPPNFKSGLRVATKLTNISRKYFASKGIECKIIRISGATELAPYLGIADVIVDQVSTGTTLAANNLSVVDVIQKSSICLIANKRSLARVPEEVDELKVSIESVLNAEIKRYVMANVPSEEVLSRVINIMPGLESPTVLKLAKPGEYAIHSVVGASELITVVRKIKSAGATDILVMNMSRMVE